MNNLNEKIKIISLIAGMLGILVTISNSWLEFSIFIEDNFWSIWTISIGCFIYILKPIPQKVQAGFHKTENKVQFKSYLYQKKWILLAVVLLIYIGSSRLYKQYIHKYNGDHTPINPKNWTFKVIIIFILGFTAPSILYSQNSPELIDFSLCLDKTSYKEVNSNSILSYFNTTDSSKHSLDLPLYQSVLDDDACVELYSSDATRISVNNYLNQSRKIKYKKYISNNHLFSSLIARHGDLINEFIPNEYEFNKLEPEDQKNILEWVRSCVGIGFPVFSFTIENNNDNRKLIIKGVNYYILETIQTRSIEPEYGILKVNQTYSHNLKLCQKNIQKNYEYTPNSRDVYDYIKYTQNSLLITDSSFYVSPSQIFALNPEFYINPNTVGVFNINFYIEDLTCSQSTILMSIELNTNLGKIRTPEFIWIATPIEIEHY